MRLIDVDKLESFKVTFPVGLMRKHPSAAHFYAEGAQQVLDRIAVAPTVDPESLRPTAYWQENGDYVETSSGEMLPVKTCSRCHMDVVLEDFESYCPHCGAKMEVYRDE